MHEETIIVNEDSPTNKLWSKSKTFLLATRNVKLRTHTHADHAVANSSLLPYRHVYIALSHHRATSQWDMLQGIN